jgi:hypothetical protein
MDNNEFARRFIPPDAPVRTDGLGAQTMDEWEKGFHPQCDLCEGEEHHWMFDADDEHPEGWMSCRHCPAERPVTDAEIDAL